MRQISTLMDGAFSSRRESSLHSAIKKWYFLEGDELEARVDDFVVDIVRGDLLIEIQIANFSAIKPKLTRLLRDHRVHLVDVTASALLLKSWQSVFRSIGLLARCPLQNRLP